MYSLPLMKTKQNKTKSTLMLQYLVPIFETNYHLQRTISKLCVSKRIKPNTYNISKNYYLFYLIKIILIYYCSIEFKVETVESCEER